jgi:hypothetical protein
VLFVAYRRFLGDRFGSALADEVFKEHANIGPRDVHDDTLFVRLVEAGAQATQRPPDRLLREFGSELIGTFHQLYPSFFPPEGARGFLSKLDATMGKRVRDLAAGAEPPRLSVRELEHGVISVEYQSERRLCPLVAGLLDGTGAHYQTPVRYREESCMRRGDPQCVFVVEVQQTLLPRSRKVKTDPPGSKKT